MAYITRVTYLKIAATLSRLALLYNPTSSLPCVTKTKTHVTLSSNYMYFTQRRPLLIPEPHKMSSLKRFLTSTPLTLRVQKNVHKSKTECPSYRPRLGTCEVDAAHSKPTLAGSFTFLVFEDATRESLISSHGWAWLEGIGFPLTAV